MKYFRPLPFLLLLAAILAPGCRSVATTDANPIIARVHGEPIERVDHERVVNEIISHARSWGRTPQEIELKMPVVRKEARDQLIGEALIRRRIELDQIEPTEQQVDQELKILSDYLEAFGQSLDSHLAETEQDLPALRDQLRRQLARNMLIDKLGQVADPTPAERRDYYDEHPERFLIPEAVRLQHIMVQLPLEPPPDADHRAQLRLRAEQARQRILAGEDFADVAREVSDGPRAADGGDVGWIVRQSTLPPQLFEAAIQLQPGQISSIIPTMEAFHLIKLLERRPERRLNLKQAEPIIIADLRTIARRRVEQDVIHQLRAEAGDQVEVLDNPAPASR